MKILSNRVYESLIQDNEDLRVQRNGARAELRNRKENKEVTKVRIDQQVFDALARELPVPCVPKTELEAGVLLGVQMVLEKIRKGWVV